jgi:hypothetical protein
MKKIIFLFTALVFVGILSSTSAQTVEKKKLVPTVTIPAPPGSKGFGMPSTNSGSNPAPRRRWVSPSVTEPREIVTTTLDEMSMSDPFIYPDKNTERLMLPEHGWKVFRLLPLQKYTK